jgi:hypothetical protein
LIDQVADPGGTPGAPAVSDEAADYFQVNQPPTREASDEYIKLRGYLEFLPAAAAFAVTPVGDDLK